MSSLVPIFKKESRRGHPLTEEMILQACHEWFVERGKWPTKNSGGIEKGFLKGNSWKSIDHAFHNGGRGLHNSQSISLGDFKNQHGLVNGATPDTAAAFARATNPDYQVPEPTQDVRRSPQIPPPALG